MAKFEPGKSGNPAGRPKGVPNVISRTAKQNIAEVFDKLGGVEAMLKWAKKSPRDFYGMYAKLLPLQLGDEDGGGITVVIQKLSDKAK